MYDMHADFEWFIEHQDELVAKHNGKVLAIRDKKVLGAFDSVQTAIKWTLYPMGQYMVQRCIPGKEAYTMTLHTPGIMK